MFWASLCAIGACANAGYYIVNKKFLRTVDPDILAASGFLCAGTILLIVSAANGLPALGPLFIPAIAATAAINVVATLLTFRALATTDISLAVPMISFTPLFLIGTAALFLGELPSATGTCGIIIIVVGSYVLNTAAEHTRISDPFRAMIRSPGVCSMLAVAFLYAVAVNFDKIAVKNSDPFFGAAMTMLLIGIAFVPIAAWRRCRNRPVCSAGARVHPAVGLPAAPSICRREIAGAGLLVGLLITIEAVSINTAYITQIAPYVIAIKRMSLLIIVLYGAFVFHENDVVRRLAGAVLMVSGAALILLFP